MPSFLLVLSALVLVITWAIIATIQSQKVCHPSFTLPQTDLPQTDLPQTDLPQTDLPQTDLPQTDLPQTDLPQTDLPQTDLPQTDLPQTGLSMVQPGNIAHGRIALLLPCYNMPEAALNIVQQLPQRCGPQQHIDVFLVDNGPTTHPLPSDADILDGMQPAAHASSTVQVHTIRLTTNVQTTHGFHLAMAAARGMAFNGKFQYEAYWMWITSHTLPPVSTFTPQDIVTPLLKALRQDSKLGAVVPALWPAPEDFWSSFNAMILDLEYAEAATPQQQLKPALLVDILGLMVRGDLFAAITREGFQPTLLRAWSVDNDLCTTIRAAGYTIAVHHGVALEKKHAIGYRMNRMSEDLQTRVKHSASEARNFLHKKYGSQYAVVMKFEEAARMGQPKRRAPNPHVHP